MSPPEKADSTPGRKDPVKSDVAIAPGVPTEDQINGLLRVSSSSERVQR